MLLFIFACLVLLIGSLPWVAFFRLTKTSSWLIAVYLIVSANIVLTGYIASSFHLLNQHWFFLTLHAVFGVFGWVVWHHIGRPSLWPTSQRITLLLGDPALLILFVGILLGYMFVLAQIVLIPQNNIDGLSTHLSRIVYWRQFGTLLPWPTYMINQVVYPVNAQLQTYWTLLFLGSDKLVGSIQWMAALVTALGIFGIARLFHYDARQSAFASLIYLTFPLISLQSSTVQTDVITAAFFILPLYFLLLGLRDDSKSLLYLSAIGIGLGCGVKKSYIVLLPVLVVLAIIAAFHYGRNTKSILAWSMSLVMGVAVLGAYGYVVNWVYFGNIFGRAGYVENLIGVPDYQAEPIGRRDSITRARIMEISVRRAQTGTPVAGGIIGELIYNIPRLAYQSLDTSGLPRPLDGYAHKVKAELARPLFQFIGFTDVEGASFTAPGHTFDFSEKNSNDESGAWYGPLSVILLFVSFVIETTKGIRKRSLLSLLPLITLCIYLPFEIILRPGWDPYQGRYFAPVVASLSPFMAVAFSPATQKKRNITEWIFAVLALLFLYVTILYNPSKPTFGKYADEFDVWHNNRTFIQTIQRKKERQLYYAVEKIIPPDATVGFYNPGYFLDYPLFGADLRRRVIPILSVENVLSAQWLYQQEVEYLLISSENGYPLPPSEYQPVAELKNWILFENVK